MNQRPEPLYPDLVDGRVEVAAGTKSSPGTPASGRPARRCHSLVPESATVVLGARQHLHHHHQQRHRKGSSPLSPQKLAAAVASAETQAHTHAAHTSHPSRQPLHTTNTVPHRKQSVHKLLTETKSDPALVLGQQCASCGGKSDHWHCLQALGLHDNSNALDVPAHPTHIPQRSHSLRRNVHTASLNALLSSAKATRRSVKRSQTVNRRKQHPSDEGISGTPKESLPRRRQETSEVVKANEEHSDEAKSSIHVKGGDLLRKSSKLYKSAAKDDKSDGAVKDVLTTLRRTSI